MKRISHPILLLTLVSTFLFACTGGIAPPSAKSTPETPPLPWWRTAIFYEIFVRSFNDTNGDGIGDFNGITAKLDYLQSLGVTAIWLMPIHPSPSYHGYDVINYYAVNSEYGTMDDFKALLAEAHKRDMRIIIDIVLNHTSSRHPWFIDAKNNPASPYRDWYVWNNDYPGNHWYAGTDGYYYAYFWGEMPDLNYNNPAVSQQMQKMSNYWLNDIGIDGFRIDAAKHLVEEGLKLESTPANHQWLKGYYAETKQTAPQAYLIGEIYGAGALVSKIYSGELDHIFNFEIASGAVNSSVGGANSGINSAITFAMKDKPDGDFAIFLTNHDQERIMSALRGDVNKAKVAASLLLTAPGTPFLYYGEEIGMTGKKPDEFIRTPMQWNNSASAGFTSGTPWITVNSDFSSGVNVAEQESNPGSLLNHYRALLQLRKTHPTLQTGQTFLVETGNRGVYAVVRLDEREKLLALVNLTGEPVQEYRLGLKTTALTKGQAQVSPLFGETSHAASPLFISENGFSGYQPLPELAPYSTYVFQIE